MKSCRSKLLHWCRDVDELAPRGEDHRHPHWQLELLVSGWFTGGSRRTPLILEAPDILVVPPHALHRFIKDHSGTESYSFKFETEQETSRSTPVLLERRTPLSLWLSSGILALMRNETPPSFAAHGNLPALEYLLGIAADLAVHGVAAPPPEPELAAKLRELVQYRGRLINVESAAAELQMTAARLKYRFRELGRMCPEYGSAVKDFLDRVCLEMIDNYLDYSKLSIGEIARTLNFPDIYALSRFYRRCSGVSPSERRRRAGR